MAKDYASLKVDLAQRVLQTRNPELLMRLKLVLDEEEELMGREYLSDAMQISLERSLAQADKGEHIPHDDVMSFLKKWAEE